LIVSAVTSLGVPNATDVEARVAEVTLYAAVEVALYSM